MSKSSRDLDYDLLLQEFHVAREEGDWERALDTECTLQIMWMGDVLAAGRLMPELQTWGYRIQQLGKGDVIR